MIISQAINNLTKSLIKSSSIHPEENNVEYILLYIFFQDGSEYESE